MSTYTYACQACHRAVKSSQPQERCIFCEADLSAPPVAAEPAEPVDSIEEAPRARSREPRR